MNDLPLHIDKVTTGDLTCPAKAIFSVHGKSCELEWTHWQDEVIYYITERKFCYYIRLRNQSVKVVVAETPDGHKYIKGEHDGVMPDSLLALA